MTIESLISQVHQTAAIGLYRQASGRDDLNDKGSNGYLRASNGMVSPLENLAVEIRITHGNPSHMRDGHHHKNHAFVLYGKMPEGQEVNDIVSSNDSSESAYFLQLEIKSDVRCASRREGLLPVIAVYGSQSLVGGLVEELTRNPGAYESLLVGLLPQPEYSIVHEKIIRIRNPVTEIRILDMGEVERRIDELPPFDVVRSEVFAQREILSESAFEVLEFDEQMIIEDMIEARAAPSRKYSESVAVQETFATVVEIN
jgi:hypothetical protein